MKQYVTIDFETTGTSITRDRIVQVAAVKFNPGNPYEAVGTFVSLVNPGMRIPKEAYDVHGISDADVMSAPGFKQVFPQLLEICRGCDIVGYNLKKFDLPLLFEECNRAGVEFTGWDYVVYDACRVFQVKEPHTLAGAIKFYLGETAPENLHDAKADAIYAAKVMEAQLKEYDLLVPLDEATETLKAELGDTLDMAGYLAVDENTMVFNFGKHKGRAVTLEKGYANWMLGGEFPFETKQLIRKELGI